MLGFLDPDEVNRSFTGLKASYRNPIETGDETSTLCIADWEHERQADVLVPMNPDPSSFVWQAKVGAEFVRVRARVYAQDILGRGIPLNLGRLRIVSPYVQVDVLDAGLVISGYADGEVHQGFAPYDGPTYRSLYKTARTLANVEQLLLLAQAA